MDADAGVRYPPDEPDGLERAMRAEAPKIELSRDWLIGEGIALTMIDTVPPDGHFADATISPRKDGGFELEVRSNPGGER